jgi:hypothetical protein
VGVVSQDPRVTFVLSVVDRHRARVEQWRETGSDPHLWDDSTEVCAMFIDYLFRPGCCTYQAARGALEALLAGAPDDVLAEVAQHAISENRLATEWEAEDVAEDAAEAAAEPVVVQ